MIILYLVYLFGNQTIRNGRLSYFFFYTIIILFYFFSRDTTGWILATIKIMRVFSVVYSLATILFVFTPSFYIGTVTRLFGRYQSTAIQQYNSGSIPGLTANCSTNAMYLCIGLGVSFSCIFSLLAEGKTFSRSIIKRELIIIGIQVIALLLTGKRGPILFLVMSFFVLYLVYSSRQKVTRWFKAALLLVILIATFFITISFVPALGRFYYRMIELWEDGNLLIGRDFYYESAFEQFLSHKLFGIGWGGMEIEISNITWNNVAYNVHNIYLQLLAERGVIGFLLYIIFFASNLWNSLKYTAKQITTNRFNFLMPMLFSCFMQTFFVLYGCTGNPLYDIQMLYPYIFAVTMSSAIRRKYK